MSYHKDDFIFHQAIYNIRCPITSSRFISFNSPERSVYYYNAKIVVGKKVDEFGDELIKVFLSKDENDVAFYINYVEEVTTFIRNGIIPMLFLDGMLEVITDKDIRWYANVSHLPINEYYKEVVLKWNKKENRYVDGEFLDIKIKAID